MRFAASLIVMALLDRGKKSTILPRSQLILTMNYRLWGGGDKNRPPFSSIDSCHCGYARRFCCILGSRVYSVSFFAVFTDCQLEVAVLVDTTNLPI